MSTLALLSELRSRDIHLRGDGDRLRCNAPPGALTPALLETLRRRKGEILAYLRSIRGAATRPRAIVPLQPHGSAPPIFAVPGHNGDVFCFLALARHLGEDQPFYGLQPPGLDGHAPPLDQIEDLAAYFEEQIRAFEPRGPVVIAGHCAGCLTAFELGRRFRQAGAALDSVAMFGAPFAGRYRRLPSYLDQTEAWVGKQAERLAGHVRALASQSPARWGAYLGARVALVRAQRAARRSAVPDPALALREAVERATLAAARRYRPRRFDGRLRLFVSSRAALGTRDRPLHWQALAADSEVWLGPNECPRNAMLLEPHAKTFAEMYVRRAPPPPPSPRTALRTNEATVESLASD
ncbi:MAG TPA: thioesterase domain-containing protein [Gemmatimonadales bacterium]|nr:thioesterase domain-containing protein [Gemmatimonadales bacterium]